MRFLTYADLAAFVSAWNAAGTRVIAPVHTEKGHMEYKRIATLDEATLNVALPLSSIKEFFLPATEVLLSYKQSADGVTLKEVPLSATPTVLLGVPPCDAAGAEVVDKVMNWDYRDELWFSRRQATTILSMVCSLADESCFCTAVGLAPDSGRGADTLLAPCDGGYVIKALTAKGEALFVNFPISEPSADQLADVATLAAEMRRKVEANLQQLDPAFGAWLKEHYDLAYWKSLALRCHGCGACASVCPTCHCFDIVDEHTTAEQGERRRNWDSCQTTKFTAHASGHNPRGTQSERYRQRVMHKFSIYPSRFEEILCTGCGRCARICPGGMHLPEILAELSAIACAEENVK